ncbi:MAG: 3-mercaptopyruvate sulfurtransferase [Hyphomicrobiaceae bacterium]
MSDLSGRYIVDTSWLAQQLGSPDLVVLDGSWYLPAEKRDPKAEYAAEHIPGAVFFDIDEISDETSHLPHMLPSAVKFASRMKSLGIGDGSRIVAYDGSSLGLMSAARVWWMFRAMGHEDIAVLDGGLRKWKAEGRPVTAEPSALRSQRHFTPRANAALIRDLDDMRDVVAKGRAQIVDARGPGRFAGTEPEPRPGLRSGHIPGARNLPFGTLLNPDGTLKSAGEMAAVFERAGIDVGKPIVTSCGSGVSAAVLSLALAVLGRPDVGLYDGSWSEWGQQSLDTEVATGA